MNERFEWPVIVVGGGPTGLTTANLLAHYGVRVLLVERNAATVGEPRAVSIDDEALRTVQTFGASDEVLSQVVLGYGSDYYSASGRHFLHVKPSSQEYGFPKRNAFRQPVFEAQLASHLRRQPKADVWFGAELTGLRQDAHEVSIRIRRADGALVEASCAYLVACDGARSFVRDNLRIGLSGSTFRERWLIVDIEQTTDPGGDTKVFCNPTRPCITLPGPNRTRRFEFMLHDGESEAEVTAPETVAGLLRLYGRDDRSPIRRTAVYTFHARVADRWSDGRVFLAGDAAHLSPPFAGQGMNSGIRDAHNLAWKLATVLRGELGPMLLATYEQERRRHAWEMILLAVRMGWVMMPRSRAAAFALQSAFRLLTLYPPARDYFGEMKYRPKPCFNTGFLSREGSRSAADRVIGRLFPQPFVETADGARRLDDVLGDGFCFVASPNTPASLLRELPRDLGAPLQIRRAAILRARADGDGPVNGANGVNHVDGVGVVTAIDRDAELAARLSDLPPGVVLLRPDRYVAAFLPASAWRAGLDRVVRLFMSTWDGAQTHGVPGLKGGVVHAQ